MRISDWSSDVCSSDLPVLRELGQTRAGWVKGSQFVFSQHCKSLRGLGVSEEKIAAIAHWTVADCYNEQERAVLAYADCLSQAGGRVPLEVFDKLKTRSEEHTYELRSLMRISYAVFCLKKKTKPSEAA